MSRSAWGLALIVLLACPAAAEAPAELRGHGGPVKAVTALAGGKTLVTGGFDSALIVWDIATGTARRVLRFHGSTVNTVAGLNEEIESEYAAQLCAVRDHSGGDDCDP